VLPNTDRSQDAIGQQEEDNPRERKETRKSADNAPESRPTEEPPVFSTPFDESQ
jgi:hypothetical protein